MVCVVHPSTTQHKGVGAKIADSRDDGVLFGRLLPGDVLTRIDGADVAKTLTSEVRRTHEEALPDRCDLPVIIATNVCAVCAFFRSNIC